MPKLTIAAGATGTIPSTRRYNVPATRKALVFTMTAGDGCWGWTPTVTAAGATDAGIPLVLNAPVSLHSAEFDFSAPVNIYSAAGCTIIYQELNV